MDIETNTDSTRKLASVQVVTNISNHLNADSLAIATVLGWKVVIRIGEVEVGEKVVYCEIDSLLPGNAKWLPPAIAKKVTNQKNKKWFRLKTIKIRGEISQGLIIPISYFDPDIINPNLDIGTDVAELLGIEKYEPPNLTGNYTHKGKRGSRVPFPTHLVSKTEEHRIQSRPYLLKNIKGKEYYMTVKLDGTSATYLIDPNDDKFLVCSRNLVRPTDTGLCPYWKIANEYNIEDKLRNYNLPLAIQGEICGPNIQKNPLNLSETKFFIFNITNIKTGDRLGFLDMLAVCEDLGIDSVPIEEFGDRFDYDSINELLEKAEGKYNKSKSEREGLVIRSIDQSVSFKVISNKYLLKK
jgi:RNA ligase (TIGR02306 family)